MMNETMATVMTSVSTFASGDTSLRKIAAMMDRSRHSCVVIMPSASAQGIPLGVVTERDIVRTVSKQFKDIDQLCARDIMTSPPVTVETDTTLEEALTLARARHLRHLLVVDNQRCLIGIVTQTNLIQNFLFQLHDYQTQLEAAVEDRTQALEAANEKLLNLAMEDSLLSIGNRRAMEVDLSFTQGSAARYGDSYQIALLDIDDFKKYNDRYGHQAGDSALQQVARIVQSQLRESDRLYRYGGEEFLILMPKVEREQAFQIAERSRQAIADEKIEHLDTDYKILTISAGVSTGSDSDWPLSVAAADKALYKAKEQGKNKTVVAED